MSKLKFTGAILGVALLAAAGIVVAQANEHNKDAATTATAETTVATTEATTATADTAVATTAEETKVSVFETDKTECLVAKEGAEAVTVESEAFKTCMMGKGYTEDAIKAGLETKTEAATEVTTEAPAATTEEKAAE